MKKILMQLACNSQKVKQINFILELRMVLLFNLKFIRYHTIFYLSNLGKILKISHFNSTKAMMH